MKNSSPWFGNLSVTSCGINVPTLETFALDGRYLYPEKQILTEALEQWLQSKEYWGWLRAS